MQMIEKEFLNTLETLIQKKMIDEEETELQPMAGSGIIMPASEDLAIAKKGARPVQSAEKAKELQALLAFGDEGATLSREIASKQNRSSPPICLIDTLSDSQSALDNIKNWPKLRQRMSKISPRLY